MQMTPREQGDLGERSAVEWLWSVGAAVFFPFGHSPDYDLVADLPGSGLVRVQVKTSVNRIARGRYAVMICTRGGNRSWSGVTRRFAAHRCDRLFVHVGDGRRFFIPSDAVEGTSTIAVGGPKYAAFEVEPGRPLPSARAA